MSAFRTRLVADIDGGLPYTLDAPLVYDSDRLAREVIVPTGFQTDLASVPRPLWNILPPMGRYSDAAVVHDLLYQQGGFIVYGPHDSNTAASVSRADADAVLLEAMDVCGVSRWQRWAIYAGVRIGGGPIWGRYRQRAAA